MIIFLVMIVTKEAKTISSVVNPSARYFNSKNTKFSLREMKIWSSFRIID